MMFEEARAFLHQASKVEEIDLLISDLNGILRGKRVPSSALDSIFADGVKLPRSVLALDIWGSDVMDSGLIWETGDGDGVCRPCGHSMAMVPWAPRPRTQMLMTMHNPDDTPFMADPRQVLVRQCQRFKERGLTAVVATELEFYFMASDVMERGRPRPPTAPETGYSLETPQVYSMDELEEFTTVFADIRDACKVQGVPGDTCIVENGPGQFEINLEHVADPVLAADQAVLFKRIVRNIARRHNLHATFMPKPYGDQAGSGFHVHCSVTDEQGRNIFDDGSEAGTPALRHAVGGVLQFMIPSMLIYAPHLNSYRRFQPGTHAPTHAVWGYENRSAAIRIPNGNPAARRFEHRVAGADANPYLVLASIMAGVLHGLENAVEPAAPIAGSAYDRPLETTLPSDWDWGMDSFNNNAALLQRALGESFHTVFRACKRQERNKMMRKVTDAEYATYLGVL